MPRRSPRPPRATAPAAEEEPASGPDRSASTRDPYLGETERARAALQDHP
ncbi:MULTISPECIES: hypothetical protein [Streptomyces]|nr:MULTISPECIES: hypothetical protein [Streptomyces]MCM9082893.1 hypothetical protein [Streptomyces spororaveus]MCX5302337.1 hypothetical protein [Streptomyces sp. NBC_00160]